MTLKEAIEILEKSREEVKLEVDNGALEYEPYIMAVQAVTTALNLITGIVRTNV